MIKFTSSVKSVFVSIILLLSIFTQAQITPDSNGIIYVKPAASGNGDGSSWDDATDDLHNAIHVEDVQKVFVAVGTYYVGEHSFIMKNGVEIYGGFDPGAGITDLTHSRVMPNATNTQGSILNGEGLRPVIWNVFNSATAMNNTAILDGFTVINGSYSNGAGIRNVYASPTLRNLVIRGNNATSSGAGIYNENSSPDIYNTVISNNMLISPFAQSGMGAGIYNGTNSAPTIVNTTIANNTITGIGASPVMVGAGVASLNGAAPKIYNSIIWNNQKNGVANATGADIENISATLTLKNSITQSYNTGNTGDNNKVGSNPLFVGATDYRLQGFSPALNAGSNALFTGLDANTKDLAGNPRLGGSSIDMGAYEYTLLPDNNGIIYVRNGFTGKGTSWADATGDLHNAIHAAGVQKVFVASGNYNVGDHSFIMKNNVEIYGGFDPANGITDLSHNRIMPNAANTQGSVLNGQNVRPVVWNEYSEQNQLYSTAVLDGFTVMNGLNTGYQGAGIYNFGAGPTLRNLVLRNNVMTSLGAALYNVGGNAVVSNVSIINNTGRGVVNSQSSPQFTNVLISGNTGTGVYNWGNNYVDIGTYTNVTIANNGEGFNANAYSHFKNSILWDDINGYGYGGENNLIKGNVSTANGNLNTSGMVPADIFTDYANGDYTLKLGSPAINAGSNTLFTGLDATTKDLAGNARLSGAIIDMGAYEYTLLPDNNGTIYVRNGFTGKGTSWADATGDLHNAIHTEGVQKVFVAVGNYNVGAHSFIMKNGVEIYGGFDPDNGITDLDDDRILPTGLPSGGSASSEGSVLNGQNSRPVIWNDFTPANALNNSAKLDGFTITNGNSFGNGEYGGGMHNVNASVTLNNLMIKNNAAYDGAGLYNWGGAPVLNNVTIMDNRAMYGGGMHNKETTPVLTNVIIKNNEAQYGGGFYNLAGSPVLTNTVMYDNIDAISGVNETMLNGQSSVPILINSTVLGNIYNNEGSSISFSNAIFYGGIYGNGLYTAEHSLIEGNADTSNGNLNATGITVDEVFNDASNFDYTLKENSPAVNAGSNALFAGLDENTTDLAGNTRVFNFNDNGIIDLGAYESLYTPLTPDANGIIYVKENAIGNGSSWDDATSDLHNAVYTTGVQKVFVAVGHYTTGGSSFVMKNNVKIYGGFDPDNGIEDLTDERVLPTLAQEGSVLDGENAVSVIRNEFTVDNPLTNTAVLDGFTLTKGYDLRGGGIYNSYASPVLSNLVVKNNGASSGGGIYNQYSTPVITNATIHDNEALSGAGMANRYASGGVFTNITLSDNTAGSNGGGISNEEFEGVFTNIKITGNYADYSSAIYIHAVELPGATSTFTNTEITNNLTSNLISYSSVVRNYGGNVVFVNATIAANNMYTFKNADPDGEILVKNSIVFNAIDDWDQFTAEYSFIQDNQNEDNGNIVLEDIYEDDVFTDPYDERDFTLKINSPVINLGNNALYSGLDESTLDLAGNPRLFGANIDLGAYESDFIPASEHCLYATIWNGTSWSNGEPDYDTQAIIDGDLVISYTLDACEVVVTANGSLRVLAEAVLYSDWSVTNLATADDFVIENNGSLMQWEDVENTGPITVLRDSNPMIRLDYTLWSSPVIGQNLFNFSPETINGVTNYPGSAGRIYVYDGTNGYVNPDPFDENSTMGSGVGYLFRSPNNSDPTVPAIYNGIFTGVPFNGSMNVPTAAGNYTSVGNPYPSNMDADDFISANPEISTLYFWNNNHNTGNNYSACVLNNCVAAAGGGTMPNGIIPVGQGFIIATSGTSVNLDNTMRTDEVGVFSKMDETEKHRFRLNLNDDEGNGYNQILIGYMDGATNGIDNQIDGKLFNYEGSALYNLVDDGKFVIQGRALPFEDSDVVPLGFKAAESGKFKIELANVDGLFTEGQKIYLKDYSMNLIHDLTASDYTFESVQGEFKSRFEIVYKDDQTMNVDDLNSNQIRIYTNNDWIVIESATEKILSVELFDLQGRLIHQNQKVNDARYQVKALSKGVLVVKVQTQGGEVITKKVINK